MAAKERVAAADRQAAGEVAPVVRAAVDWGREAMGMAQRAAERVAVEPLAVAGMVQSEEAMAVALEEAREAAAREVERAVAVKAVAREAERVAEVTVAGVAVAREEAVMEVGAVEAREAAMGAVATVVEMVVAAQAAAVRGWGIWAVCWAAKWEVALAAARVGKVVGVAWEARAAEAVREAGQACARGGRETAQAWSQGSTACPTDWSRRLSRAATSSAPG